MKTIIAGSRTIRQMAVLKVALRLAPFKVTSVISGTAPGADQLGERYAKENALPLLKVPANWDKWGRAAGPIRNKHMAQHCGAEAALILWDGTSRGTANMIRLAHEATLEVFVFDPQDGQERLLFDHA